MSKGTCAVTGATGFLGHHIAQKMKESGWSVIKMQRKKDRGTDSDDKIIHFSLGDKIDPASLADVDLLIHCAYDFKCNNPDTIRDININGTKLLLEAAKKAKVGLIVFISSMHAFEGCRTMYGRAKLAGEQNTFEQGGVVIRPGTIYVDKKNKLYGGQGGGTLQFFEKLFRILPIVPILYSKRPTVYTSHLDDLLALVEEVASKNKAIVKPICAVNEKPLTLKQFLVKIKDRQVKKNVLFIPVPWQIPWFLLIILEKIKFKLPFRSESILTFFDQNPAPDFSVFEHLKTRIRPF
ncbi:MAG: NAD(P)-dependent oxidoreductase [Nitrospiraceae bacterium]|nr:MAG: NAD(P)-dependent oxidoreductase [Nitrospiraceae bacterium]